jgi:hypothetical protein
MCWSHYHHYRFEDRRQPARRSVSDPVDTPANVRVSDADRNRVIEVLKQHAGEGRLTLEEFEARVDEALAARTGTDLRRVLRELPVPPAQPVRRRPSFPVAVPALPVIVMVVVFIALIAGHLFLLPLVFVAFFWFPIGAGRHRRSRWVYDPRRDDERDDIDTLV